MSLQAGRVGVDPSQVDLFGKIIGGGSGDAYTKAEADAKFLSQTDAASIYESKSEASVAHAALEAKLDEWSPEVTVASNFSASFLNIDDTENNGYILMCERENVKAEISAVYDANTDHMSITYLLTGAQIGDKCKLRILK